ncbi:MAG: PKD domain-containing protein [Gemmatimonadota bacterium]
MHRFSSPGAATIAAAALVLSACSDVNDSLSPDTPADIDAARIPAHAQGSPPDRAAIAAAVPEFGGVFLDDGAPTVYLTDTSRRPQVEGALSAWLAQEGYAPGQVRVRRGDFDYLQLSEWFEGLTRGAFAAGDVVFTDLRESENRIVVGVSTPGAEGPIRALASGLGISPEALVVEEAEPILALQSLQGTFDPMAGGIQIHFPGFLCTLGFGVGGGGTATHFVTNSHCTTTRGGVEGTPYWQPLSTSEPAQIGTEAADPAFFSGGGCPGGSVCRRSDAALIQLTGARAFALGAIARPLSLGSLDAQGTWAISEQRGGAVGTSCGLEGAIVFKVGRTTGYTRGRLRGSCIHVGVSGTNIVMLFQELVDRISPRDRQIVGSGDSGSPTFTELGGGDVRLEGILWGGNGPGSLWVFSPMPNIVAELGALNAVGGGSPPPPPPPPAGLNAAFSFDCSNSDTCSFDASASTGVGTLSYAWDFDDGSNGNGVSPSHIYGGAGDFVVELTVTDDNGSDTAMAAIACRQRGPNLRCK